MLTTFAKKNIAGIVDNIVGIIYFCKILKCLEDRQRITCPAGT